MTEDQTTKRSPSLSLSQVSRAKRRTCCFLLFGLLKAATTTTKKMKYYKGFIIGKMNERLKMKMCVYEFFFCFQK